MSEEKITFWWVAIPLIVWNVLWISFCVNIIIEFYKKAYH